MCACSAHTIYTPSFPLKRPFFSGVKVRLFPSSGRIERRRQPVGPSVCQTAWPSSLLVNHLLPARTPPLNCSIILPFRPPDNAGDRAIAFDPRPFGCAHDRPRGRDRQNRPSAMVSGRTERPLHLHPPLANLPVLCYAYSHWQTALPNAATQPLSFRATERSAATEGSRGISRPRSLLPSPAEIPRLATLPSTALRASRSE